MSKPEVNTTGVHVSVSSENDSVSAVVYPTNHPRTELNVNGYGYVRTSEVQEIVVVTRNTKYIWRRSNSNNVEGPSGFKSNDSPTNG